MTGRSCRNTGERLPAVMNTPPQQSVAAVASYPFIKLVVLCLLIRRCNRFNSALERGSSRKRFYLFFPLLFL